MPMIPFMEKFPELAVAETRSARVAGHDSLPDGDYGFFELYCNEPGCDCRRVIVTVLREDTGWRRIWATISYGWETPDFYRKRLGPLVGPDDWQGPSLDPLNPQTQYSAELLNLFRSLIRSPDYVQRLRRHYEIFRAAVEQVPAGTDRQKLNSSFHRRQRLRDPRRRRKS